MKKLYILFLLLGILSTIQGQTKQFFFKKYQVESGLSHNTVWCVLQDSYGFMWFGTSDGLNRFDGQRFKVYRNDIQDNFSLGNNAVQSLFEDERRNIWIGTTSGIYIYNRTEDQFIHFNKKTDYGVSISSEIKKVIRTEKGQIWIATLGQGIFIYEPKTDKLKQHSQYTSFVWDISQDKNHRVYSSSLQEGLICYDLNGKRIESYTSFLNQKESGNLKINSILVLDDNIWFSVGTNTLAVLDSKTKQIKTYNSTEQNIGTIRAISDFSERELLVGSDNGLYIFNTMDGEFTRVDNPLDSRSLSDQSIYAILKDAEGGFWISTYLGGVNYLAQQTKIFDYYYPSYDPTLSSGKVISQFCEDENRNIWIGAQDGLKFFNNDNQRLEHYILPTKTQKLDIRSLLLEGDNLWIGTYSDGLKVYNTKTRKIAEYYHARESSQTICSNDVLSLYKDRRGDMYIGTTWGLCRYNRELNNFETLNFVGTMISVFDIKEDKQGFLWIATYNSGVFRYNPDDSQWKHFLHVKDRLSSITSNSVITLFEDSEDKIWFGTNGGGLCYFNEDTETFTDFDPQNQFLPNKVIYSIEEDNVGNFWISSNAGLLRINPTDNSNRKLFTQEDGLQSNQFNFKASLKSSTGKLYFGGINGFNSFYPNDFKENSYIPPVYIVDVRLYNTEESKSRELLKLSGPIYMAQKITLPFDNNSIVLEFDALSYEKPDRNKYRYILEGFDKIWVNSDNSNLASYTNLPPGEYTFRVKGSNNDGKWNENGTSIKLRILPPWWKSTFAYIVYAFTILVSLFLILRYFVRRSDKKFKQQLEEYQIEKEKEVYQSKIRFFINLVHEIRTPLSLIRLPLEKLSDKYTEDPKATKYISIINKNVTYLLNVVSQLLEFQKIESQDAKLSLKEQDINQILTEIYEQFDQSVEFNNINLKLSVPESETIALIDKEKIIKIIMNLMSNAMKYAKTQIEIQLQPFDDHFEIRIIDDGPGIPDAEKEKVFEAFYQINEGKNTGTGIGLAFSKLLAENHRGTLSLQNSEWGGSTFLLSVPTNFEEELLAEESIGGDIVDLPEQQSEKEIPSISETLQKSRILLVEDNEELLELIEDSLKPYFSILKAGNGKEALSILEKENIDLIVSDVMMPEIDGLEFCKIIKSDMNYSHIPVILLTAKATLDAKIEGMEYGADVYIEKPFSIKHLQKQIENLLKLRLSFQRLITTYPIAPEAVNLSISRKDKEFIERLHTEIESHIAELDFSIDNIAETMFMSRSSFYRKIKSISGMSPSDYLKMIRLNKAAELIIEGNLSISEICEQVAFSSSSYFAKCFKTQFGVLPKDYTTERHKGTNPSNEE